MNLKNQGQSINEVIMVIVFSIKRDKL